MDQQSVIPNLYIISFSRIVLKTERELLLKVKEDEYYEYLGGKDDVELIGEGERERDGER